MIKKHLGKMVGRDKSPSRKSHDKIGWSWLGAFVGVYMVATIPHWLHIDAPSSLFLLASFSASAVLIYGAPQAELSQPRNLIGGHIISAFIGITVYKYMPLNIDLLSALAVSLSIVAMDYTRTLHPPGGATALIAVVGGDTIHELGYFYVVMPIAVGALVMLFLALIINNLSSKSNRDYPRYWL
jgi:CBS domain-containing membrane protein